MDNSGKDDMQEFADAFQRGEDKGFTYFFRSLYAPLVYYANRIVNDKSLAEDVVEEAFIKIWERHSTFSHPKVIKAWLYTTVRNGSLTILQKDQRTQAIIEQITRASDGESESYALREIIRAEVLGELYANIETLPNACRQIFKMLYIEGKTVRDIATELNLSISTIKNQKARGLSILRKKMPGLTVILMLQVLQSF